MKQSLVILSLFCLPALGNPILSQPFIDAQQAYDEGRYADAVTHYESILSHGVTQTEVYYNLANAEFKMGQLPSAVAHYRRAWYSAPRDPDIRANLQFALNAAGAVAPAPNPADRFGALLNRAEWIGTGVGAAVILMLMLTVGVLVRPIRRVLFQLALLPGLLILLSLGGEGFWRHLETRPEWVTTHGTTARYAPVEGSTIHYEIPAAALVRQCREEAQGWVNIEYDGNQGWVMKEQISRVCP